jgi:hypothetical protein
VNRYKVESPVRSFSGESVGVTFRRGTGFVDDSTKDGRAAIEYFRRQGYALLPVEDATDGESLPEPVDSPAEAMSNLGHGAAPSVGLGIGIPDEQPPTTPVEFDPSKRSQDEVIDYLDTADDDEVQRVKAAEAAGKDRKQIAAYERKTTPAPQTRDDKKGQSA